MRLAPLALSISLGLSTLSGCDSAASLTSEEHIQRARDRQEQGDVKGSVIELKNAVQKDPENAQARWLLGQAYLRSKLAESAIKELETAKTLGVSASALQGDLAEAMLLKRDYSAVLDMVQLDNQSSAPQRAEAMRLRADALLGMGKANEACALYTQATETDPKLAKAHIGLGVCAYVEGKQDTAREHIQRAISLDERNPDHKLMLANIARSQGNSTAALQAYDSALTVEPANIDALAGRALLLLSLNRAKDAEKDVKNLRSNYPKHFMATYLEAAIATHNQEFEKARDLLQQNLKSAPNHLESLFLLGTVNIQMGQLTLATQNLNNVLRLAPGFAPARTLLAGVHLKNQQPKSAYEVLLPILRGNPTFAQLGLAGEALLQMGRASEASALFKEAAKLDPKSGAPSLALGRASLQQSNAVDALYFMQQASHADITRLPAELFMIKALWQQGDHAGALSRLAEVEKTHTNVAELPLLRGSMLFEKGDRAAARAAFEKAVNVDPGNTRAILALVDLDNKEGQPDQAKARLEKALKAKPGDEALLLAAAVQAGQKGQRDVARNYMERAAKANPNAILPQQFLVQAALEDRQLQRAQDIARAYSDRRPDSREAKLLLANTQFAVQDFKTAIAGYKRLLADTPNDPNLNLQLGLSLLAIDRTAEARSALKKAVSVSNEAFAPLYALTSLEARSGNYAIAQELAMRLQNKFPQSEAGPSFTGDIAFRQKQFAKALDAYQRAFAIRAGSQLTIKLADTLDRLNRLAEAESRLADWIKRYPEDNVVRQAYADRLGTHGKAAEAIEQYEVLLKKQPQSAPVLNNLANLLASQNPARALKLAQTAYELAPASPHVMDTYGWLLVTSGRATEGLPIMEKAHRALPEQRSVHFHYAVALAKTGNPAQAKRELEKLLAAQAQFPERQEAAALLKTL